MDKELNRKINDGLKVGGRIADALEQLVNEPLIQIQPSPPQCPHCQAIDPVVTVPDNESISGRISGYILEAICKECKKPLYGVVVEWVLYPDMNSARQSAHQIAERSKDGGNNAGQAS